MAELSPDQRAELVRLARSRATPHAVAGRARLVVDASDAGATDAARRAAVSRATAVKWRRRYLDAGLDGLRDIPGTGRPPIPDDVVRRILRCTLDEPPDGADRWTTRAVSAAVGVSQATVSRTRRRFFPRSGPTGDLLQDRASVLAHVGVHPCGSVLAFHAAPGNRDAPASPARVDAVETIVCAALLRGRDGADDDAVALLRGAVARLPVAPAITVVVDVPLDAAARTWLRSHPAVTVRSVTGDDWFGLVHRLADAIDPGQLAELREVQRRVRAAGPEAGCFAWTRDDTPPVPATTTTPEVEPVAHDLSPVIHALCAAVAEGELQAAGAIPVRRVARRSEVSPGRVVDALDRLATEAIIEKRAGRYLLPTPTARDVAETYTARGLLGTAITRRLASAGVALPPVVDEIEARLVRCHELGLVGEACSLDLDLQDELARAATLPRIGSMFVRLTLQLRLFLAIFGLSYRYPTEEIVADDRRILDEIRRQSVEPAVEAWRSKIDNCARYMLARIRPPE